MIAILLADGFEEIEALTPLDILRRQGFDARTVAVGSKIAIGAHGISVVCDIGCDEVILDEVSMVIFPGGMPGALNLDSSPFTNKILDAVTKNGGRIAAICASPLILGRRGLLSGKHAVCYPGFEEELVGAIIDDCPVITDGNITTAKGMGVSLTFSLELVRLLKGEDEMKKLREAVIFDTRCAKEFGGAALSEQAASVINSPHFAEAVEMTLTLGEIGTIPLQRALFIGYGEAVKIVDAMEALGIATRNKPGAPWRAIISRREWEQIRKKYKI